jgi:hypothetical protein
LPWQQNSDACEPASASRKSHPDIAHELGASDQEPGADPAPEQGNGLKLKGYLLLSRIARFVHNGTPLASIEQLLGCEAKMAAKTRSCA